MMNENVPIYVDDFATTVQAETGFYQYESTVEGKAIKW